MFYMIQAVQSPMLDYSHFISLPLAIHPDLVEKLNNFQRSILGVSASNIDSDKDEILSEGSVDEIDEAASPSVPVKQPIQEEKPVIVKMDNKGSQPGLKLCSFCFSSVACSFFEFYNSQYYQLMFLISRNGQ